MRLSGLEAMLSLEPTERLEKALARLNAARQSPALQEQARIHLQRRMGEAYGSMDMVHGGMASLISHIEAELMKRRGDTLQ